MSVIYKLMLFSLGINAHFLLAKCVDSGWKSKSSIFSLLCIIVSSIMFIFFDHSA